MPVRSTVWLAFAIAVAPGIALAEDEKGVCVSQHEQGQLSRRAGHFDSAREQFSSCTRDACPAPVRKRCAELLAELDAAQPTLVIAVHDAEGRDVLRGTSMTLDRGSARDVPATALRVDPGEHVLRVAAASRPPVDRPIVVREGEKERRIDVVLPAEVAPAPPGPAVALPSPSAPSAPSQPTRTIPVGARVSIGVSAASLLAAGTTSAVGWGIHGHLASSCSPGCTESQVEPLRILWPTSFIALGVGVVTGAIALTLVLTNRAPSPDRTGVYAAPGGIGWRF